MIQDMENKEKEEKKPYVFTAEHKENLRLARLGKKHPESVKKAIGESVKKSWHG